jgi:hypothetical protein
MNFDFDWKQRVRDDPRFGGYYRVVADRPSWVTRAAIFAVVLVVVVPLVLLTLAAVLVGAVVFTVLGAVAWVLHRIRLLTGAVPRPERRTPASTEGDRENVRVIR